VAHTPGKLSVQLVSVVVTVVITGLAGGPDASAGQSDFADFSTNEPHVGALSEGANRVVVPPAAGTNPSQPFTATVGGGPLAPEVIRLAESHSGSGPADQIDMTLRKGEEEEAEEYDPWEPYNEKMFAFNHDVFDRFVLKPVATAWDTILPDAVQRSIGNVFENLAMPRRLVNNLLQLKFKGAGYEVTRFLLNTTIGVGGIFDIAKEAGVPRSDEDTGQTFGVYGVGPGPYLILPFLPPLTVRDGIGFAADTALDPLNYVLPFAATAGKTTGKMVNDRSANLELFESVEENVLDLYSAVRNAYLQRRQKAIME
jgi:phospholipid-binding lipoprotein MlaA